MKNIKEIDNIQVEEINNIQVIFGRTSLADKSGSAYHQMVTHQIVMFCVFWVIFENCETKNTTKLENYSGRFRVFDNMNRNDMAVGTVVNYK